MLEVSPSFPASSYAYGGSNIFHSYHPNSPPFIGTWDDISSPYGNGLFDIAKNILTAGAKGALNTSTGKKLLGSKTAQRVLKSSAYKNLKKAANSKLGKEIQKSLLSGVSQATDSAAESALQKLLGVPTPSTRKRKKKRTPTKGKRGKGIILD